MSALVDTGHDAAAAPPRGAKIACCVEYDGSAYAGWQSQRGVSTVQATLETALAAVASQPVRVHCAGRTDAGVHALCQWVHFEQPCSRSTRAWVRGGNANLPGDVRLLDALAVSPDFHARFSARARHYRYIIINTPVASALCRGQATWIREPLDASRMHNAAQVLLGEQDFSAFRAASCQSPTAMRCVHRVAVRREGRLLAIDISANAFLHHMVRNIAGALIKVGAGKRDPEWVGALLRCRDRTRAAATAPPSGLYLAGVTYPTRFGLPADPAANRPFLFGN